ncbi:glutamine--fructose-6-phosphate transaminase (isomerizing) [Candidatus Margulisiibacteriota bacterium]
MCGIFGYIGTKNKNAIDLIVDGLKRLDYRGYDSSGLGTINSGNKLHNLKCVGKIADLEKKLKDTPLKSHIGIGHTRWATHGEVTEINSHPHVDTAQKISLVHNGIIENFSKLKEQLITEGSMFASETDTEVIPHLIAKYYATTDMESAVLKTMKTIEGSYAFVMVNEDNPNQLLAARKGSPLVLGIGDDEFFLASDISAILPHTRKVIYLAENEIVNIDNNNLTIKNIKGKKLKKKVHTVDLSIEAAEKGGYEHFMLKEIYEQPNCIMETMAGRYDLEKGDVHFQHLHFPEKELINLNRIVITACGTSFHAGVVGKYFIEKYCRLPVEVEYAAEFRYRNPVLDDKTLVIAVSQSGETADTLAAVYEAKKGKAKVISICNVMGSTLTRESTGVIYTRAGIEIGVASTKAFTTQIVAFYMFAIYLARLRYLLPDKKAIKMLKGMLKLPKLIKKMFDEEDIVRDVAKKFSKTNNFLYLGRGVGFPLALEGALKMKEISYIHAEGYSAAEMKHGPIALIDKNMPVIVLALKGRRYDKIMGNIAEIKSRKGIVIAIATHGDTTIQDKVDEVIYIPDSPEELTAITSVIPLQLLAYHTAVIRECNVDQPRNLAKSVTVE